MVLNDRTEMGQIKAQSGRPQQLTSLPLLHVNVNVFFVRLRGY